MKNLVKKFNLSLISILFGALGLLLVGGGALWTPKNLISITK
jgi:hypothetical protein